MSKVNIELSSEAHRILRVYQAGKDLPNQTAALNALILEFEMMKNEDS